MVLQLFLANVWFMKWECQNLAYSSDANFFHKCITIFQSKHYHLQFKIPFSGIVLSIDILLQLFLRRKHTLRTKRKVKPLRHLHRRAEFFSTKLALKVQQVHLRFWTEDVETLYGMYVQGHRVFCINNQFLFIL